MSKGKTVFYAIARGRIPGVYDSWRIAKKQVDGYSGHLMNSFRTREAAQEWISKQWAPKDGAPEERWKIKNIAPVLHPLQIAAMRDSQATTGKQTRMARMEETTAVEEAETEEMTEEEREFREMVEDEEADRQDLDWVHQLCLEPIEAAIAKGEELSKGNRTQRRAAEKLDRLKQDKKWAKAQQMEERLAKKQGKEQLQMRGKNEWRRKEFSEAWKMGKKGGSVEKLGEVVQRRTGKPWDALEPKQSGQPAEVSRNRNTTPSATQPRDPNGPPRITKQWSLPKSVEQEEIAEGRERPLSIKRHYGWSPLEGMGHNEEGLSRIDSRIPKS